MKFVFVEWVDASHYTESKSISWFEEKAELMATQTAGYLLRASRKQVVIAHEISDGKTARDVTVIPRGMIKKIHYLKEKE